MPLYKAKFDLYARFSFVAADRSFLAESYPALYTSTNFTPATAGRLEFTKIKLPVASVVTSIQSFVITAGSTLTAGQCFAALYTGAGALLAQTADQSGTWNSTGTKVMALAGGAQTLAAGSYYIGYWYNGTTAPTWPRSTNIAAALTNQGFSAPNLLAGNADTGLTTTAPSTMGAQTTTATFIWAALV